MVSSILPLRFLYITFLPLTSNVKESSDKLVIVLDPETEGWWWGTEIETINLRSILLHFTCSFGGKVEQKFRFTIAKMIFT